MKKLEDLLDFHVDKEDLQAYVDCDDKLKEVFRVLCVMLNQWGYKPRILEVDPYMMRVIIKTSTRRQKKANICRQLANTLNCIFDWIPYTTTAKWTDECYNYWHFRLTVPKDW